MPTASRADVRHRDGEGQEASKSYKRFKSEDRVNTLPPLAISTLSYLHNSGSERHFSERPGVPGKGTQVQKACLTHPKPHGFEFLPETLAQVRATFP